MNPSPLVIKFGGTSVGNGAAIAQAVEACRRVRTIWPRLVVVTSAMSGVTNLLLDTAAAAARGETFPIEPAAEKLRSLHSEAASHVVTNRQARTLLMAELEGLISGFTSLCQAIAVLGEATPRALDAVGSLGERLAAPLLAAALDSGGLPARPIDASRLILTDEHFLSAHPDMAATSSAVRASLIPILDENMIPVVTGFIGATPSGVVTTLGRGGSDYSAAILGAALPAGEVWIYTDVNGVMTADPRLAPDARTISELSFREVGELAYFGAKVLHPKTVRPVLEAGIGLRVLNTFELDNSGTRLVMETDSRTGTVIKAVTAIRGLKLITIEGRGMLGVPGVAARTFASVAATGVSVPLITQASSEQSICFAVPAESTGRVLKALETAFAPELAGQDIDSIWAGGEVAIVTVVGAGMRSTPGVAGRVFTSLGQKHVNVIAIAQGSSEVSISLVVDSFNAAAAVRTLHELIE